MARIYAPNEAHNVEHGVTFINGVAMVPDENTELIAWFEARGYDVVPGDVLFLWDYQPGDLLRKFAPYAGITGVKEMSKKNLVAGLETVFISLMKIDIAKYDNIVFPEDVTVLDADTNQIDGGAKADPIYESAAKIIALLPEQVTATFEGGAKATVEVTSWADTTGYDTDKDGTGLTAKDYVFTATLGTVPNPFDATGAAAVTVKVAISEGT